jgi:hypothetical protein
VRFIAPPIELSGKHNKSNATWESISGRRARDQQALLPQTPQHPLLPATSALNSSVIAPGLHYLDHIPRVMRLLFFIKRHLSQPLCVNFGETLCTHFLP